MRKVGLNSKWLKAFEAAHARAHTVLTNRTLILTRQNITKGRLTVIGPQGYQDVAKKLKASFFDIGHDFKCLSQAQKEAAERYFLDLIAIKGDKVRVTVTRVDIKPGSWTEFEVTVITFSQKVASG